MTCIVGIIDNEKIWMGCDTQVSSGSRKSRTDTKIIRHNDLLLGFSGNARELQLMRFGLEIPEQGEAEEDYEYIAATLTPAIQNRLKDAGAAEIDNNVVSARMSILIGYRKRLYTVSWNFAPLRIESQDYHAIGSGMYYALGSLFSTKDRGLNTESRIRLALETAEEFDRGVSGPFVVESLG